MQKQNVLGNSWRKPVLALLLWSGLTVLAGAKDVSLKTEANVMTELTLTASRAYADPFNEVTLDLIFLDPKRRELRVPAFWAGDNVWKVRYASPVVGTHRFRSKNSDARDKGLHGITGKVEVKTYKGPNPLYAHGPLRVSSNRRFMEHADGTPFFWLGDTWWMGLCHRLHWPEDFKTLAADRKAKGFNLVQIVAGLYPDMHPFDPRGANEAGYPWETNYARIRPKYFDAADKRLLYLVDQGFTPCIVGAWGYFIPWMRVEKSKQHWRYLVARYGALPVVWCVAGEANLPWYLTKGFPFDDRAQVKDWTEVTRYLRQMDPFHRSITIHPTGIGRLSARNAIDDISLLDIDMLQTPHAERAAVSPTVRTVRESYADKPVMPVINGEPSYEMLNGKIPAQWVRRMFWLCMMNGAAGHTYGANGIWQVNRRGEPHGASPHGGNYGTIPWDESMNLPGSGQVALGKKLLEQFAWQKFQPHPELAVFANKSSLSFEGCHWIWFPEGKPAESASPGKRIFRRTFVLPEGKAIRQARLRVSVDDRFSAWLNGEVIGFGDNWQTGKQFNNLGGRFQPATNVLVIRAENVNPRGVRRSGPLPDNPAGLMACLEIQFADGESSLRVVSDAAWHCAKIEVPDFDTASFDDAAWPKAAVIGRNGDAPWGKIGEENYEEAFGPQSSGIPGVVRLIYVPESETIIVRNLGKRAAYSVIGFDPVTGAKTALAPAQADDTGSWTCPPPADHDHDWVLVLEAKAGAAAR